MADMKSAAHKGYKDRILPMQGMPELLYKGTQEEFFGDLYRVVTHYSEIPNPDQKWKLVQSQRFRMEEMGSTPITLQLLTSLALFNGSKRGLELGAFIGLSAMAIADGIAEGGEMITIEKFPEFAEIAQQNFSNNGYGKKIKMIVGDANEEIPKLTGTFDFVFLDANKERYADQFEQLDALVSPGGLLLIDDVLFDGDVLNAEPTSSKGAGAKRLLDATMKYKNYHKILLPLASGVMVMRKNQA